jgi:hypothetical protein
MQRLGEMVRRISSKNAGPFWVTVDIFCGSPEMFERISKGLATSTVAALCQMPSQTLMRFDIPDLCVVKFSMPRPVVQGSRHDRDMHGAQLAVLLQEYHFPE